LFSEVIYEAFKKLKKITNFQAIKRLHSWLFSFGASKKYGNVRNFYKNWEYFETMVFNFKVL
jgi:hypothetical protein